MHPYRTAAPNPNIGNYCCVCWGSDVREVHSLKHPSGVGSVSVCLDCIKKCVWPGDKILSIDGAVVKTALFGNKNYQVWYLMELYFIENVRIGLRNPICRFLV